MDHTLVSLPQISISFAPPQEPVVEPYSPFSGASTPVDDNAFRPVHLTPPPTLTKFNNVVKPLSPLRPSDEMSPVRGLERERFEALLQASKERNLALGSKKACDLRKEIALKAHKTKQVERRALFLSKVLAPPSPTATLTPKTPPESPAIFHYTLPSPGLVSPLALFESLSGDAKYGPFSYGREPWVEQVDFRAPKAKELPLRVPASRSLPSLDQISARMTSQIHSRSRGDEVSTSILRSDAASDRPRPQMAVGRLQMPVRTPKQALEPLVIQPCYPADPFLQDGIASLPQLSTVSSTELAQAKLSPLTSRERRAHDMLSTLRRRTDFSNGSLDGAEMEGDGRTAKWKRHSAPADLLPLRERSGFEHPVLALPGGF